MPKKINNGDPVQYTEKTIRDRVLKYGLKIIEEHKERILNFKKKKRMFTITHDEYRSIAFKKYLNIVLHLDFKTDINLGLIRILNSSDAQHIHQLIIDHLNSYGVYFETDIIAQQMDVQLIKN